MTTWRGRVVWAAMLSFACVPLAASDDHSPLSGRGTLKTFRVHNVMQCRRLCWYVKPCARYSYYREDTNDNSCRVATTDNSCGKGDNCVLHAASPEGEVWTPSEGWEGSVASADHLPPDHACAERPCGDKEICVPSAGLKTAVCVPVSTNADIDECASSPCQNGGTCVDHVNAYTCNCATGFHGTHCQTDIDECASSPCQNGGACVDQVIAYTCNCTAGFNGTHCQTDIDECASSPCQNGGTCVDQVNAYTCNCTAGFNGTHCQTDIDECASSPCQNGGTCVDQVNAYTCNCTAGFNGTHCQTDIDECASSPCQNGGTCVDQVNAYTCNCTAGFNGTHCQTVQFSSVAVGAAGVWGVNGNQEALYMEDSHGQPHVSSNYWVKVPGEWPGRQLDVGTNGVWGVNVAYHIFYRSGISSSSPTGHTWMEIGGSLAQISVGPTGRVWGTNSINRVYSRLGTSLALPRGSDWAAIGVDYHRVQLAIGENGVWTLNTTGGLSVRQGIDDEDNDSRGASWRNAQGPTPTSVCISVSSGPGYILVVDENGAVYYKEGVEDQSPFHILVQPAPPSGLSGRVKMVDSAGTNSVYGVTTAGELFRLLLTPITLGSGSGVGSGFEATVVPLQAGFRSLDGTSDF